MVLSWYRHDKDAVVAGLRRGERPDVATTMSSGPLDDLVALHDELGVFAALGEVDLERQRAGIDDRLLLRTLGALPFESPPCSTPQASWLTLISKCLVCRRHD